VTRHFTEEDHPMRTMASFIFISLEGSQQVITGFAAAG
jgi:hypothetical protein